MIRYLWVLWCFCIVQNARSESNFDSLFQVIIHENNTTDVLDVVLNYFSANIYLDPGRIQEESQQLADYYAGKNPLFEAKCKRLNALTFYVLEDYDRALDILLPLIDICKEHGTPSDLGAIYSSLAIAYRPRRELETAENYSKEAIRLFEMDGNFSMMANTANNLANHYMELEKYDEAEIYFEKAIPFFRKSENQNALAFALLNRGMMHIRQYNNERGIEDIMEILPVIQESQNSLALSMAYTALGNAEFNLSHLDEAEHYLVTGYKQAKKINHSQQVSIAAEILSRLYAARKDYKGAYDYHVEWAILQDSFKSAEQDARLVDALKKYESEKKEKEINFLSIQNEVANRNTLIAIVSTLAIALLAVVLYRNRNKIKKINSRLELQKVEITQNLKEKDFLLKEIHHRVKNNLQVISSLLNLQSKSLVDSQAKRALDDGRLRVRSMALIHQNLYQKNNLTGIKMEDYIEQLAYELVDTYKISKDQISLDINVDPIILDVETVVPIGLIINELVSNSLKYAFDTGENGLLEISLSVKEEILELKVSDNGKGFDKNAIPKDSFGMSLIEAFAHRLNAQYQIESDKGTVALFAIRNFRLAA